MTDLDQEGISGRLRARFSTYQDGPPRRRYLLLAIVVRGARPGRVRGLPALLLALSHLHRRRVHHRPHRADERAHSGHRDRGARQRQPGREGGSGAGASRSARLRGGGGPGARRGRERQGRSGDRGRGRAADRRIHPQPGPAGGRRARGHPVRHRDGAARSGGAARRAPGQAGGGGGGRRVGARRAGRLRAQQERSRPHGVAGEGESRRPAGVGARGRHVQDRGGGARRGPQAARSGAQRGRPGRGVAANAAGRDRPVGEPGGREPRVARRTRAASASRCGSARPRSRRGRAGSPRPSPTCSRRS